MTTTIDIRTLAQWGEPKRVNTKVGPKILQTAPPNDEFSQAWNTSKQELREAGISWGKDREGNWQVCWWQPIPESEQIAKREAIEASRATDADVVLPCPTGKEYLPYQKAGIAFALRTFEAGLGVLLADEMGLGKTIQAIGLINAVPTIHRVLIICPASLKINWRKELGAWLTRDMSVGIASGDCFPSTDIVIINYDVLHKWTKSLSYYWDLLIVDEAHYCKNPKKARRAATVLGLRSRKVSECKSGIPAKRRIFLTGTPIVNKPVELYPLINALDPKRWANFFAYAKRFCGATQIMAGHKMVWDFSGASRLEELQQELRGSIMVRRLKKDVLKDLPSKRRMVIELSCDAAARQAVNAELRAWEGREDEIVRLKARVELSKASDNPEDYRAAVESLTKCQQVAFTSISEFRHQTALAKVKQSIDLIREDLESVEKIVVFCHHRDVVDALRAGLSEFRPVFVVGGMNPEAKNRSVEAFQKDPAVRVIVGTSAMREGLTLTAASLVVMVEFDWVPGNNCQSEDRCHRIGQHDSVLVKYLVLEGSLDVNIARKCIAKQEIIDRALDNKVTEVVEPIYPSRRNGSVEVTLKEVAEIVLSKEQIQAVHEGLKMIAGMCNGAVSYDSMGFSKVDVAIGHSLAEASWLSSKQGILGRKIVNKYRRQLPTGLLARAGIVIESESER